VASPLLVEERLVCSAMVVVAAQARVAAMVTLVVVHWERVSMVEVVLLEKAGPLAVAVQQMESMGS